MAISNGMVVSVRAIVTAVDNTANTATIRVLDNNNNPISDPYPFPQGVMTVVGTPFAVNDVVQNVDDGQTAVVRWVSSTDGLQWSPAASGANPIVAYNWRKVGTATITG